MGDLGVSILASGLAGITARLITHPFDTLKTVAQAHGGSTAAVLRRMLRDGSWKSLYRGLGVACALQAPALAVYLSVYDASKSYFSGAMGLSGGTLYVMSGFLAETASAFVWTPMEIVKQRLQASSSRSALTAFSVARDILRQDGPVGFLRGYSMSLVVFVPYSMIYFLIYENLKIIASDMAGVDPALSSSSSSSTALPFYAYVICSGIAGGTAGALTTGLDVVKTRWQLQQTSSTHPTSPTSPRMPSLSRTSSDISLQSFTESAPLTSPPSPDQRTRTLPLPTSPLQLARQLFYEEGIRFMFRGMAARVMWLAPSVAISMSMFEVYKLWLNSMLN